jgi:hypothetical protein
MVVQEEFPVVHSGHLQLGEAFLELLISQHICVWVNEKRVEWE